MTAAINQRKAPRMIHALLVLSLGTLTGCSASRGGGRPASGTLGTSSNGTTGATGSSHPEPWKVMLLGDSVTGSTCYPQVLSRQLIAGGHRNFQLVGAIRNNQSCGANAPSVKTEGHGGYNLTDLPENSHHGKCTKQPRGCGSYAELQSWAAKAPDIVLVHFGTNDVWDGRPLSEMLDAYVSVIVEFRKRNPKVIFFVSKIIKLQPAGCEGCLANVEALAAAVNPTWAAANSTARSPVRIVDHYDSGFDPNNRTETGDGVHPSLPGATLMATTSYNAIVASGYF